MMLLNRIFHWISIKDCIKDLRKLTVAPITSYVPHVASVWIVAKITNFLKFQCISNNIARDTKV
jgi:hypothetical protein